jgi:hypothetical protein
MDTETLIDEFRKLPPDQKQVVKELMLSDEDVVSAEPPTQEGPSLYELFAHSPFADLDFELPQGVRSPIRPVKL